MMIAVIVSLVLVAVAAMIVVSERRSVSTMKKLLKQAQENSIQLENKIQSSRDELRKSKEELEREKSALREAREQAKKKLKRAQSEEGKIIPEAVMSDKLLEDKERAISAMETQIEQLKKEQGQQEEALKAKLSAERAGLEHEKNQEVEDLKKRINELQEELKKQKRLMRPEGHKIDLKALPDEAASEFARVFRKAEQHERLHGIARAKLHLAQEKFTELQKRYFSVCRELALLAGKQSTENDPNAARDIAEDLVAKHQHDHKPADADNT